jgi:cell division protein ZipA
MPELRIILLVAGVLFIAALAGWEWWRSRGTRPAGGTLRDDPAEELNSRGDSRGSQRGDSRTDARQLPEIHLAREPRTTVPDTLPVIEMGDVGEAANSRSGISLSGDVAIDVSADTSRNAALADASAHQRDPYLGPGEEVSAARIVPEQPPVEAPQLVLAWPKESDRRIVTLRVTPKGEPRFAGRALRQALSAAGFWHGPLDIYHLPDEEGRVVVSVAALAQPGTFDPSIMDSQRFSGLNLFAVLPGPLSERDTFETLVQAARSLAERLDGQLTDQHGSELTAARVSRLRQSLDAPSTQATVIDGI